MGLTFSVKGEALGFAGYSGTTDYMSFVVLGAALHNFITAVFWGMGYSLKQDMDAGVLESNWLAPVPRLLLLVGRTFTSILITTHHLVFDADPGCCLVWFSPYGQRPGGSAHRPANADWPIRFWICFCRPGDDHA